MIRDIFINGRFLSQSLSGQQRYARELTLAIDRLGKQGELAHRWRLVAPRGYGGALEEDLRFVEVEVAGPLQGHGWEQTILAARSWGGALLSLCGSGPMVHPCQLVAIHDAAIYRNPKNFSRPYRLLHKVLDQAAARGARLCTVSDFSRGELAACLRRPAAEIALIPNGWDHLSPGADPGLLAGLGLSPGCYFLHVGNLTPNKGLSIAAAAFRALGRTDLKLVSVGSSPLNFSSGSGAADFEGVEPLGRVDDRQLAALYGGALSLLFPSAYEGFGIPPLEALSYGCPVISSDLAPVREVCGPLAAYVEREDIMAWTAAMETAAASVASPPPDLRRERLERFRWCSAARTLARVAHDLAVDRP